MLASLLKVIKILNSEASPWQIGWALALGVLTGLLPFGFLTLIILFVACIISINLSIFFLSWGLAALASFALSSPIEAITWQYAQAPGFLQFLANTEILQVLHLHHTSVLGSFILGLLLMLPLAWFGAFFVSVYRKRLRDTFLKLRIVQVGKASRIFQLYQRIS